MVNKSGNNTQKKRRSQADGLVKVSAIQEMTRVLQHNASRIATRDNYGSMETISLQEMIARDAREFLLETPTVENRFAFYRRMEKLDPEVKIAKNYLALMIQRSYLGPRLDRTDKGYQETAGFLSNVNVVLAEMQFASRVGSIAKDLIRHGNSFLRVKRDAGHQISSSEIIPPDSVTILSDRYIAKFKEFKGVLNERNYYVMAEKKSRSDEPYEVMWDSLQDPEPNEDGTPAEIVLPAKDMLHVSWDSEGHQFIDSFHRETYNIWGESVYESIIVYVKGKLMITTDYLRWMRQGMPRWVMSVAMDDILKLSQYEGDLKAKTKAAIEAAKAIFAMFESQLYYYDDNEESPTYRKKLPIEPDAILALSDKCVLEQKGGTSAPDPMVMNFIKECNRSIASALGVPMTLFGYEEGSTYAVSKITAKFMAGYGGGLLRTIEVDVKEFLKAEFKRRGAAFKATPEDWENLYLEYDRDDIEDLQARNNVDLIRAQVVTQLASAASTLYQGGVCSLNDARAIMREGLDALTALQGRQDGDALKPLQPMITTGMFAPPAVHHSHSVERPIHAIVNENGAKGSVGELTLEKDEPLLEKEVKQAISDSYVYFIEDIARKVENGEIGGKHGKEIQPSLDGLFE
jgi:hypothetical protein